MVVKSGGAIVLVDNEHLRVGALDYDLARCWCRWNISRQQRDAFCRGYGQHRKLDRFAAYQIFWFISVLSLSAKVHLKHGKTNEAVFAALEKIAADPAGSRWSFR